MEHCFLKYFIISKWCVFVCLVCMCTHTWVQCPWRPEKVTLEPHVVGAGTMISCLFLYVLSVVVWIRNVRNRFRALNTWMPGGSTGRLWLGEGCERVEPRPSSSSLSASCCGSRSELSCRSAAVPSHPDSHPSGTINELFLLQVHLSRGFYHSDRKVTDTWAAKPRPLQMPAKLLPLILPLSLFYVLI